MKKAILLLVTIHFLGNVFAQVPESFQYQAVVRDAGAILANTNATFRISIIETSTGGSAVYVETHNAMTNDYGIVTLAIGDGIPVSGDFSAIDWADDLHFIKVEIDLEEDMTYEFMGTTQLLSVPYALNAKTADNVFSGEYADLNGKPVNVSEFDNDAGYLTSEEDGSVTNEIQTLSDVLGEGNDAGGNKISNLADPEDPQDAVTKQFLKELLNRVETIEKVNGLKIYKDTLTDVEGNQYRAIEIGNQTWMADNLRTTKYSYGSDITGVLIYNDDESYAEKYGRLYTWNDAMDSHSSSSYNPSYIQGACPDDWHLPSDAEWKELELYLGLSETDIEIVNTWRGKNEGGALKGIDTSWDTPNESVTNSSGFYALPSGMYRAISGFIGFGTQCHFISSTEVDATYFYNRALTYTQGGILRSDSYEKAWSYSVRCVKDKYPILHNALGSISEVENSAYGPDGTILGSVNFNNDVKFEKGITPNTGDAGSGVDFPPSMLNPEAGCIEMWTTFYTAPVASHYGVYGFVNVAHWTHAPVSLYWHNSSSTLGGTVGFGAANIGVSLTGFNPALNTPVHIAMVWDRNGIDGTGDYLRIYVDGVVVATNNTDNSWGTDTSGNFRVAAPWDEEFVPDRYSVDNIKVWDYARTYFKNRIFE